MATNSSPEFPYPGGTPGAEPPDPVAGKPGHFAWSRWVKQFVKNLNANLMAHIDAADPHPQYQLKSASVYRVTHPNVDDVLAEVWDTGKARWQRIHYDSGWRLLTDRTGFPNWTAGDIYLRRENDRVTTILNGLKVGTLNQFWSSPLGFQNNWTVVPIAIREGVATGNLIQTTLGRSTGGYWWLPAGYTYDTSHNFTGEGSYMTADPIPTSLPGAMSSGAPALTEES